MINSQSPVRLKRAQILQIAARNGVKRLRVFGSVVPDRSLLDQDISQMIHPQLTTVQINRSIMSRMAMQRLVARMEGDVSAPLLIHAGARLIVRESSAAPAGGGLSG